MSFICRNGFDHRHNTVEESKMCWGVIPRPSVFVPTPSPVPARRPATMAQIKYAEDLGGDPVLISRMDFYEISSHIDELKRKKRSMQNAPVVDPRMEFAKSMLQSVDDGYYAVRKEEGASVFFLRVSRPKSGDKKGAIKVQSMHGTAAVKPSLMEAFVLWPSNKYSFFGRYQQNHWKDKLVESILMLVADTMGAAKLYAQEIGRCCRCNASLTDDRSRHYGIGPECEKYWPHIIELTDAADALRDS